MTLPFRTTRRIEFADTDMAGIVHFANFFRFMEAAEVEFLRARGLSVALTWEGDMLGFPRVAASCDYLKPAMFEDVLDVSVRVARLGRKSVTYAFEFAKNGDVVVAKINGETSVKRYEDAGGSRQLVTSKGSTALDGSVQIVGRVVGLIRAKV